MKKTILNQIKNHALRSSKFAAKANHYAEQALKLINANKEEKVKKTKKKVNKSK